MEKTETKKSMEQVLDKAADDLRSGIDADRYKDYLLGFIFYKYLSDRILAYVYDDIVNGDADGFSIENAQKEYKGIMLSDDEDERDEVKEDIEEKFGFFIDYTETFEYMIERIRENDFEVSLVRNAFNKIELSSEALDGLFSEIDLDNKGLGGTVGARNKKIQDLLLGLNRLEVFDEYNDKLGDAYEYLIGRFASNSGKNAGEFYTPAPVSDLMSRIVTFGKQDVPNFSVYDATMGSGSLLLHVRKYIDKMKNIRYYGQELNVTTYNLAKMNMIMHDVPLNRQFLNQGNTLSDDWPDTSNVDPFDAVLMNPPYSQKWSARESFSNDPRFAPYGVLAPKSKADFAFLLHGFSHLSRSGTMAIVLPHGVLFRGNAEAKIRKKLLEDGHIEAIIGLPSDIFNNTGIPTTILVLKKERNNRSRDVLFIDASKEFTKQKKVNMLEQHHIDKIMEAYVARKDIDKFAHVASFDEIKENDFNLNIPRYVDTFEPEPEIDLVDVFSQLVEVEAELKKTTTSLFEQMSELEGQTPDSQNELNASLDLFKQLL